MEVTSRHTAIQTRFLHGDNKVVKNSIFILNKHTTGVIHKVRSLKFGPLLDPSSPPVRPCSFSMRPPPPLVRTNA